MLKSIISVLALSLFAIFASATDVVDCDSDDKWFNIKINAPGDKYITHLYEFEMDMKDGTMGFNRTDATKFEGYITGTEPGESYLVTPQGFAFLDETETPDVYNFAFSYTIPDNTIYAGNWSVNDEGHLACHNLTAGFKYFKTSDTEWEIRWDTTPTGTGSPVLMEVEYK